MKATGIVRRIDELGRVVIPKEIRRTLRIREGDPLELFTERDELMLKKYSPIASIEQFAKGTAKSLSEQSGYLAVICDTDGVLQASGQGKKSLAGKSVSDKMTEVMLSRSTSNSPNTAAVPPNSRRRARAGGFSPIRRTGSAKFCATSPSNRAANTPSPTRKRGWNGRSLRREF